MSHAFRNSSFIGTLAFIGVATVASVAQAGPPTFRFYQGVRSLGMGGTYVTTVNDETSLLTNPAGLGRLRDVIFTIADPEVSGSFNNTEMTTLEKMSAQTPSDLLRLLKENKGKHWHAKAQVFPSIVAPNVGFGIHGKYNYDAEVNKAGTIYRLDYTNDYAAVLGFSFRLFGGMLKIGGAGRYVNRTEIHKDLDPNNETIDMNQTASEGAGLASDAGIMLTAPIAWLPTIGATVRDAGNTSYTMTSGMFLQTQTRPAMTPQTIDVGYALFPILSNYARMTIALEYHDVGDVYKEEWPVKHAHGGVEFNFADFFFLRGGYSSGYWTGGIELATEYFQLQGASYGEEIGIKTAPKEDRRWVGKISIRF